MQQREKTLLAVLLGAVGFWVLLPLFESILLGPFQSRIDERQRLEGQVATKTKDLEELEGIERQLLFWSVDSLPPEPLNAQRVYADWLMELARLSGFRSIEPNLGVRSPAARVYTTIPVTLTAEATLKELATFLFHFERTRLLHRIVKCDFVSPETEGNPLLAVTIVAEGLSLPDGPARSRLFPRVALKRSAPADAIQIEVETTTTFPPDDMLRVRIGREFLSVTQRAGAIWTVARGLDGTTAAEHAAGEIVEFAPLQRNISPTVPQSIADYERLLESGPFVKPRPPFVYRPQLAPIADQTLIRGDTLEIQAKLTGWDPANGQAKFALDEFSPASMTIDDEGNIAWSPKPTTETGDYPVGVIVTSPVNPNESLSLNFNVTLRDPNLPPQLTLPAEIPIAWIGRIWTLPAAGVDPDQAGPLEYSLSGTPPAGLTIDPANGVLRWELPPEVEPGEVPVSVQVADAGDPPETATATINVRVEDDAAQYTYLVGCLRDGDRWTAFLYDRSSNQKQFLKVGDAFQIADIAGKVAAIDLNTMEFEDAQGRWRLDQEQPLRNAELLIATAATTPDSAAGPNADAPIETAPAADPPSSEAQPDPPSTPPAAGGDDAPPADR